MIYYISDLHLGHDNILAFDGRPFNDTKTMGEEIKRRWNLTVEKGDTVYILGDVVWRNSEENIKLLKSLNGQKHLVKGNHDRLNGEMKKCYESISDYKEITDTGRKVVLSHYPMPVFKNHYYKNNYMLYGHVHNTVESMVVNKLKQIMENNGFPCEIYNVGCMVEYMSYTPRTLDYILEQNKKGE